MPEVQRLAVSGVTGDIAHGKLLKAAFEHELKRVVEPTRPAPPTTLSFIRSHLGVIRSGRLTEAEAGARATRKSGLEVDERCRPRGRKRAVRASCQGYRAMVHYRLRPRE